MKRQGLKKGITLLPNIITTANMFCGFFAMVQVMNGQFLSAAWVLCLGGLFDLLDGRVARMTKTESEFGLEYDSLSDLTSFGLAPALLLHQWTLHQFGHLGWAVSFLFLACGALRLARFNVQVSGVEKKNFQGLPIPAAAACPVTFVILHHHLFGETKVQSFFVLVMMVVVALLMVSNVSYRSFKVADKSARAHFFLLVLLIGFLVVIAAAREIMLFVTAMIYAASGVLLELTKSGQRIKSLSDVLVRFFHAHPDDLSLDDNPRRKKSNLSVLPNKDDERKSQNF